MYAVRLIDRRRSVIAVIADTDTSARDRISGRVLAYAVKRGDVWWIVTDATDLGPFAERNMAVSELHDVANGMVEAREREAGP